MTSVFARVLLAVLAVVVLAGTAMLLRDQRLGSDAGRRLFSYGAREAELDRQLDRLVEAGSHNPDTRWELIRAAYLGTAGRRDESERLTASVLRAEPDNLQAWGDMYRLTVGRDPAKARAAMANVKRLNPLGVLPKQ